jgi:transketolase
VRAQVEQLFTVDHPAYLRLGVSEEPAGAVVPPYAPWRRLISGQAGVLAVVGPLVGGFWEASRRLPEESRPTIWLVTELPVRHVPAEFLDDVRRLQRLLVVEEHVAQGGLGQMLATRLLELNQAPSRFRIRGALGYRSGRYGSQKFHRQECGLDPAAVLGALAQGDL